MPDGVRHMGWRRHCSFCDESYSENETHRCQQPDVSTADAAREYIMGKVDWLKTPDQVDTFARAIVTLIEHQRHAGAES